MSDRMVTVYGATGHTGRFVVAELRRRGWTPILSGRDSSRLRAMSVDVRPAAVADPAALDRAVSESAAVINAAGPFAATATPVVEAARRAGIPYLDVAAEIEAIADTVALHDSASRAAGVVVVPAMAFFGGLADLLATAAARDWTAVDEVVVAYAIDSWHPTDGTRAAGRVSAERRGGGRVVHADGALVHRTGDRPVVEWDFPAPVGRRTAVAEFTMADSITIPRHLATPVVHTYMDARAVRDVTDPDLPPPVPAPGDELGRSAQTFLVEVVLHSGGEERRAVAQGRDIYAISAPLVVEAAERILDGRAPGTGVLAPGQLPDAPALLHSLPLDHLDLP